MTKDGADGVELAAGNQDDWILPMTLGIAEHDVYFERITKAPDNTVLGSLYRTAK